MATSRPSLASWSDIARPMPRPPPVTSATRSLVILVVEELLGSLEVTGSNPVPSTHRSPARAGSCETSSDARVLREVIPRGLVPLDLEAACAGGYGVLGGSP